MWVREAMIQGRRGNDRLLQAILACGPAFRSPKLAKEQIWQEVYPDEPYSDPRLKLETKVLFDIAKALLAFKELERQPQQMAVHSLAAIQQQTDARCMNGICSHFAAVLSSNIIVLDENFQLSKDLESV